MRKIAVSAVVLVVVFAASAVMGENLDVEIQFAGGLTEFGYYKSADFLLEGLDWRARTDEQERNRIVTAIADNNSAWAGAAETQLEALERMREAVAEVAAFIETEPSREVLVAMQERLGYLLLERGTRAHRVLQRQTPGVDLDAVADEAATAFEDAVAAFGLAREDYRERVEAIEAKRDITDDDRRARAELLPKLVVVETQMGWARYRLAQLHQDREDEDAYLEELDRAMELFKAQRDAHDRILAGYSAALGYGLCLQEVGKHEEAIEAFESALRVERSEATIMVRFQARYQKAISLAELGQYESAMDAMRSIRRDHPRLPSHLDEPWRMNYGRFHAQHADTLRAEEQEILNRMDELREQRPEGWIERVERLGDRAQDLRRQYREVYEQAIRMARDVAEGDGEYAQEARRLLGTWAAAAGIERMRTATDHFARGESLVGEGDLLGALEAYRRAIMTAAERGPGQRIAHDAWIQTGKVYASMGRHYEAGLVFGRAANLYPGSDYAENLAIYSSMLLGHVYERDKSDLAAESYFDAQEFLVNHFPANDPARRAAFRLGDVQRAQGNYAKAAEFYMKVDRASAFHERARFLAGQCLWRAATENGAENLDRELADASEKVLRDFIAWAKERPAGNPEAEANRVEWLGKSMLLLAEALYEQGRHGDAVAVVADGALEAVASRPDLVGGARVTRVKAYCAKGDPVAARMAGADMERIRESDALDPEVKSGAAQLVGTTFLAIALDGQASRPAALLEEAREYLVMAIDLKPEPEIADYEEAASSLYQAEGYAQAAEVFQLLVERYADSEEHAETVRDARHWVARCHQAAGDWTKAVEQFAALVQDYPRAIDIRRDLASAYGSDEMGRHADAERHWRVVEESLAMGSADWFEARYQRVRNLALAGRHLLAFQLVAATRVPYPEMGGAEMKAKFEAVVKKHFPEEQQDAYEALAQELDAPAQ